MSAADDCRQQEEDFAVGTRVTVCDLVSAVHWNGCSGSVVVLPTPETGRYGVQLDEPWIDPATGAKTHKRLAVRRGNLTREALYLVRHSQGNCVPGDWDYGQVDLLYAFTDKAAAMESARVVAEIKGEGYSGYYPHGPPQKIEGKGYAVMLETQERLFTIRSMPIVGCRTLQDKFLWAVRTEHAGIIQLFAPNELANAKKHAAEMARSECKQFLEHEIPLERCLDCDYDLFYVRRIDPLDNPDNNIAADYRVVSQLNPDVSVYGSNYGMEEAESYLEDWHPTVAATIQVVKLPIRYGPVEKKPIDGTNHRLFGLPWTDSYDDRNDNVDFFLRYENVDDKTEIMDRFKEWRDRQLQLEREWEEERKKEEEEAEMSRQMCA